MVRPLRSSRLIVYLLMVMSIFVVLRGDISRLERCTAITTGSDLPPLDDDLDALPRTIKRSKPFKYTYEKEIVMYAYFKVRLLCSLFTLYNLAD